jgi:hypothetical protein
MIVSIADRERHEHHRHTPDSRNFLAKERTMPEKYPMSGQRVL